MPAATNIARARISAQMEPRHRADGTMTIVRARFHLNGNRSRCGSRGADGSFSCFPAGLGRARDRKGLTHIRGEHCAIVGREARQGTPLVPGYGQRLLQHAASMRQTDDPHFVAPALKLGRNDRYAMPRLGERQQCMRVPALERIVGFSPAIRLAASKARRNPKPPSSSSNGNPARSATSMVRLGRAASRDGRQPAAPQIPAEGCRSAAHPA